MGIALVTDSITHTYGRMLRFVPTDCPPLEFHAVWHRQEKSMLLQEYLEVLRTHVAGSAPVATKKGPRHSRRASR
jgi:hypothetical protein